MKYVSWPSIGSVVNVTGFYMKKDYKINCVPLIIIFVKIDFVKTQNFKDGKKSKIALEKIVGLHIFYERFTQANKK